MQAQVKTHNNPEEYTHISRAVTLEQVMSCTFLAFIGKLGKSSTLNDISHYIIFFVVVVFT